MSHHCESSCDSLGEQTGRRSGHTGDRDKVSLWCGFSCELLIVGAWRKTCHKQGRGRAVLHYGSADVTLSLQSNKTTSDIFCSQKASLPNECGCESLVYLS